MVLSLISTFEFANLDCQWKILVGFLFLFIDSLSMLCARCHWFDCQRRTASTAVAGWVSTCVRETSVSSNVWAHSVPGSFILRCVAAGCRGGRTASISMACSFIRQVFARMLPLIKSNALFLSFPEFSSRRISRRINSERVYQWWFMDILWQVMPLFNICPFPLFTCHYPASIPLAAIVPTNSLCSFPKHPLYC